jgi:hypothetical protein
MYLKRVNREATSLDTRVWETEIYLLGDVRVYSGQIWFEKQHHVV